MTNGLTVSKFKGAKVGLGGFLTPGTEGMHTWHIRGLCCQNLPPRKPTWQYRKTTMNEDVAPLNLLLKIVTLGGAPLGMFAQQQWKVMINRYWRWWLACWVGKFCTATYHRLPEPQKNSDKWCGIWKLLMPLYKRASIPNINRSFRRMIMDQFCAWGLATKFLPMDSSECCDCDCSPFHPWFSEFSAIGKQKPTNQPISE